MSAAPASARRTILVADDATGHRAMLDKLLGALGFDVLFAEDGRTAINLFVEYPDISLILMDIRMPGINGIKATQEIRLAGGPTGMRVPIVAITAADGDAVRRECLAAGMTEVLIKPLDPRRLVETIRRLLP